MIGFSFKLNIFPRKKAMTFPAISNTINTSIGTNIPTSTTVDIHLQPPSDVAVAVILGTPFACDDVYWSSILVDGDSGNDELLCSIEVDSDSSDDELLCSIEVDSDSSDDELYAQLKWIVMSVMMNFYR